MTPLENRTLALAGVAQACKQVRNIAENGSCDQDVLITAIKSILNTNPQTTEEVYENKINIHNGLRTLIQYSDSENIKDMELTKTIITCLALSNRLLKRDDILKQINTGIEKTKEQVEFFSIDHTNVISGLAGLYQSTISTMTPRILVAGNPVYLEQSENASRVRTLLLSAIRSAILWHQLGGSRWQLLFQRKKIIKTAQGLLNPFANQN